MRFMVGHGLSPVFHDEVADDEEPAAQEYGDRYETDTDGSVEAVSADFGQGAGIARGAGWRHR